VPQTIASQHTGAATALRTSVMRLARRLRQEGAEGELTPSQLVTLVSIERLGPLTLGELAAHERVQPPSITRIVAALEAAGLVERTSRPGDRRTAVVTASRAGRALVGRTRRRRDVWLEARLAELDPADRAVLEQAAGVLERLAGA